MYLNNVCTKILSLKSTRKYTGSMMTDTHTVDHTQEVLPADTYIEGYCKSPPLTKYVTKQS